MGNFQGLLLSLHLHPSRFSKKPHASCRICIYVLIYVNYRLTVNGKIARNLVIVLSVGCVASSHYPQRHHSLPSLRAERTSDVSIQRVTSPHNYPG